MTRLRHYKKTTKVYNLEDTGGKRKRLPDINLLEQNTLKYIVGQDKPVKQIITAIYKAKMFEKQNSNILIIGANGTGKTSIIKQISKQLKVPYVIEDANKFNIDNYAEYVQDIVQNLIVKADYDTEKAENGIVAIKGIDQKVLNIFGEYRVLKTDVLKAIRETKIVVQKRVSSRRTAIVEFDTKNIIIIFLGSFPGLDIIRKERVNSDLIGFSNKREDNKENRKSKFSKNDLIEYGMAEDFVDEIDTIIEMNDLTKKDLVSILKESKRSTFNKYQNQIKKLGVTLKYPDNLFEAVAEESLKVDSGARELKNTVNYIFENITYDILANPGKYSQCNLGVEIVKDNTKYKLS